MTERTFESFRDFCVLMLGSASATPLKPQGAEDIINGATISALGEVWKAIAVPKASEQPAGKPAANGAPHDPLGLRQ